jgi:hypothetical protein
LGSFYGTQVAFTNWFGPFDLMLERSIPELRLKRRSQVESPSCGGAEEAPELR